MIECDKCPDKLRCSTGQKEECDRGFNLKMCCRNHLASRKKEIIKLLLDMPNEIISNQRLVYEDVCPMCKQKIFIRLGMDYGEQDELSKLREEIERLKTIDDLGKVSPNTEPWTYPNPNTMPYPDQYPGTTTWGTTCKSDTSDSVVSKMELESV
jgi:hypothetical protein